MGKPKKNTDAVNIAKKLLSLYPDAKCELSHESPFQLLIATILSAQTTDERVNAVSPVLFALLKEPKDIYNIDVEEIEKIIREVGLYKAKARYVYDTCKLLVERFEGEVPKTRDELTDLPGVGRKVANVVLSNAFGVPEIAVDTHVKRVANRLGLADSDDVLKIELALREAVPREMWIGLHHAMIFHGRRLCKAKNPLCRDCPLAEKCPASVSQIPH